MQRHLIAGMLAAGIAALAAAACGGSSSNSNPSSPSPTSPGTPPGGAVATNTITITNNSVSPKDIVITRGSSVTFVNNDNQTHDMESDPHPEHTDCPALAQVGFMSPGQSKTSAPLTVARVCGFHDHNQSTTQTLWGTITVQ